MIMSTMKYGQPDERNVGKKKERDWQR